jgi:hypothetical protein
MAYDETAAQRLRAELGTLPGLTEKKMFGGICFLLGGNMVCGVLGDELIMRVGAAQHAPGTAGCAGLRLQREADGRLGDGRAGWLRSRGRSRAVGEAGGGVRGIAAGEVRPDTSGKTSTPALTRFHNGGFRWHAENNHGAPALIAAKK